MRHFALIITVSLILVLSVSRFELAGCDPATIVVQRTHAMESCAGFSANSALELNKTYGGSESDFALALVQTSDGGYALAGRTYSFGAGSSDIWLVKTDGNGNHLWNRTYGGTNVDGVFAFAQTVDGGYALAGHTYSFGAGNYDFWLVKTDSTGNMMWNKTYGGTGEDMAYALVQMGDGGYAIAGETNSFGTGNGDVWLVKTDAFGNHLWNRTYGGTREDDTFAFVQTVDGGFALAGHTYSFGAGSCDAWLVKTSADGSYEWNKTFGGISEDFACRVIQTNDEGYVLAGSTKSYGAGSDDFWLVKTDGGASTIIVPDDYSTIQEALNNAFDGDTVFVRAGTYHEHVVVNKTVSLVGEDVSTTTVDGSGTGNVFALDRDGVIITGFTVQNGGGILGNAGIRLDNANLCSMSGNRIRDNFAGIWFEGSSENLINANNITANIDDGIVFNYSHNNTISGNNIGLHEYFGIVINWSHNNTISWNNVTQTFGPSHGDGINLWRSSYNSIFQNQVEENNRYGIRVEVESDNNTVSDNKIRSCLTGIQVYNYSNYNDIRGNRITNCSNGIELNRYVTHTTLSSNTIENSEVGININSWSVNNTICENCLAANGAGIRLYYSNLNEAFLNNITDSDVGAAIQYSQGNMFYSSNFMNNTQQVSISVGYANAWDIGYPSGGNYWSDYTGSDCRNGPSQNLAGCDGIGDTPNVIDSNNRDNCPFMKPIPWDPDDIGVACLGKVGSQGVSPMKTVIGEGTTVHFSVFVMNYGATAEAFNITTYINATLLETQTEVPILSRGCAVVNFTWDTSLFEKGSYVFSAQITAVPGETDTDDNSLDCPVTIGIIGDVDNNGVVNMLDIYNIALDFGAIVGQARYVPNCDIDDNGVINMLDLYVAAIHYGETAHYWWPMFGHDLSHIRYSASKAPDTNNTLWRYTTGNSVCASPAVVDGRVYIGSGDYRVYCFNASTGAVIWRYTTGGYVFDSPAVVGGRVYVGSSNGKIYCLNASTGVHIWNYTTGGEVYSSPAVAAGRVYVGSYDGKVYCLDASTGICVWNYTTDDVVESSPAVVDGRVYVGSYDCNVYCLDASTGVRIWNYTTGDWVWSSPAVVDGKVYVGSKDFDVYCLNASTGAHIWNYTTSEKVISSPAVVDGRVYIGSGDCKVYCLDALTGAQVWNHTTGDHVFSSPAVADGKVYIGSYDGKVYCLDASTGAQIWKYATGNYVYSSPAVADGAVYVGSADGRVYAFATQTAPADSAGNLKSTADLTDNVYADTNNPVQAFLKEDTNE